MSARAHFGKYVPCSRRMYCANSCFSKSVRSTVSGDEGAAISRGVMSEMPLPVIENCMARDGARLAFIIHTNAQIVSRCFRLSASAMHV